MCFMGLLFISISEGDEQQQKKANVTTFYEEFKKGRNSLKLEVTYLEHLQYLP